MEYEKSPQTYHYGCGELSPKQTKIGKTINNFYIQPRAIEPPLKD